ncbi:unnamed protein product [Litomosoides sigmodontis]|uniref:Uncharacterized protein n=1 Tax=Litomosoides sigmodontis TaxID=42156 RepID=A0A3P6T5J5_LITSI|nr:unnamed protein product [Litomosoides sigmodontis]
MLRCGSRCETELCHSRGPEWCDEVIVGVVLGKPGCNGTGKCDKCTFTFSQDGTKFYTTYSVQHFQSNKMRVLLSRRTLKTSL